MKPLSPRLALISFLCLASNAGAVVLYQSDFESDPVAGFNLAGGGVPVVRGNAGPGGSGALQLIDNNASANSAAILSMNASGIPTFSTATAGQENLRISADFAVTSMTSSGNNTAGVPRLILRSTTTTGTAVSASSLTIGMGQNSSGNLVLYASRGDNAVANATNNLTLFNFGAYSATAGNNVSGGYINIAISYFNGADTMTVTATRGGTVLGTGTVGGFTGTTYSNTTMAFLGATGTGTTGSLYMDNVDIQVIPEPTLGLLGAISAAGLLRRRR
jgi:hypothetical protein